MKKVNIYDIDGMEFPSGRITRVMYGENGAINGEYFCQGYVIIFPGGSVPVHEHETIETYTILKGHGEMTIGDEVEPVREGDTMYIDRNLSHSLRNTGSEDLHMMFVYAPKMIAAHWAQEKEQKQDDGAAQTDF